MQHRRLESFKIFNQSGVEGLERSLAELRGLNRDLRTLASQTHSLGINPLNRGYSPVEKSRIFGIEGKPCKSHIFADKYLPPCTQSSSIIQEIYRGAFRPSFSSFVLLLLGLAALLVYAFKEHDLGTGTGVCALIWTVGGGIRKVWKKFHREEEDKVDETIQGVA
jgi:hypothetical protein